MFGNLVVFSIQIFIFFPLFYSTVNGRACSYNGWSHRFYKDSCCDNEAYELGHGLWDYGEECYGHPVDNTLPFRENHWVFYECVINKTLNIGENNPLTELAFMEMMSKNLSPPKRDAIMRMIKTSPFTGSMPTRIQYLKLCWHRYFTLEMAVCSKLITKRCGKNAVCLANAKRDYEPEMFCRPANSARAANFYKYTKQEFDDCMNSKSAILRPLILDGPEKPKMVLDRANLMCRLIATSHFDPDVEFYKTNCDFQSLFLNLIPRFASSSSKDLLFRNCRKLMERRDIKLEDSANPFTNFVKNFVQGADISTLTKDEVFMFNLEAGLSLALFADKSQELTCFQQWE